jgi:NAD(P)-dependent dehydrogenase (short-subunit alcohol dehydrogenase family)
MSAPTILITGANGGLGVSVVQFFLEKGFRVIAIVARAEGKKDITPHPALDIQVVDLSDESATASFIAGTIAAYHTIDAALLLVGGFAMGGVAETTGAGLAKMFTLNFETAYFTARPLYAQMLEQGQGRLIFIGSKPSLDPAQGKHVLAYALSKSLLFKLAEILNADARGKDVVAHVVVPSTIDTPANRKDMPDADVESWVRPEQLAEIFYFICSEAGAPLRDPVWKVYNKA